MTIYVFIGSEGTPGVEGDYLRFGEIVNRYKLKDNSISFYNKKDKPKSNDTFLTQFADITKILQNDTKNKITHSTVIIFISAHGAQSCSLASPQFYLPNNKDGINISELINRVQNYSSIYLFMDTCRVTTTTNIIPSSFNVSNKNLMIVYGTQQAEVSRGVGQCGGLFLNNVYNKMEYNNLFGFHVDETAMISLLIDIFINWSVDQWIACYQLYKHIDHATMERIKSQKPSFQLNSTLRNKYAKVVQSLANYTGKSIEDVSATKINTSIEDKKLVRTLLEKTNNDIKDLQAKITAIKTQLGTSSDSSVVALERYNSYVGIVKQLNDIHKKYQKLLKSTTDPVTAQDIKKSMNKALKEKLKNKKTADKFNELYTLLKNYEELQHKKVSLEKLLV
ncbi:MAG: hypothetical protein Terrestrivirus3_150 [Terrestrivirus sp.]|uniref:Caspase domain protein n=1 Tax=Terrestrivirus sp. TaxID=2487775 RepID=A0A3G4ZPJ4_9VIRU|nr:MAG: hypothetical protein Terrestrivirus3_150 [Terrestrivirus sp.]